MTCIHGAEHVVSLFFDDVFKLEEFDLLAQFHNRLRNYFGSVRHSPAAMFRQHSKDHNNGIPLSFIKIAETRMGGKIIALLRLLRLRDPLVSTIVSSEFRKLNVWRAFCSLAQKDELWQYIFSVCRAFYPVMRVLRLADSKIAVMDKLYFYVRMADTMMEKYLPAVESSFASVVTADFRTILSQEGLAVNIDIGSDDEDSLCNEGGADEEDESEEEEEEVEIDENISVSSEESCEGDEDDALAASFETLTMKVMDMWKKRTSKLTHDFARAGWMLSPNPTIMADAKEHATSDDTAAVERLLFKLILSPTSVGMEREMEKGRLSQQFWDAHKQFHNRDGDYNKPYIWLLAAEDDCKSYEWHQRYSKHAPVLCALACRVLSKVSGIGSAERNWKEFKRVSTPARNRTHPERTKMMCTVIGHHCAFKASRRREKESRAGRLWNDRDFTCLKLDKYGIDVEVLAGEKRPKRIFRAWKEGWEEVETKKRDPIIETKLVRKYGGMQWADPDNGNQIFKSHPKMMYWKRERKKKDGSNLNGYYVLATTEDYDLDVQPEEQDECLWDFWERNEDFYELVVAYYKEFADDYIDVYERDGAADSDSDD